MQRSCAVVVGGLVVALPLGLASMAMAQAPGSVFGQSPQQLQQRMDRAPAPAAPAPSPFTNPAAKAPNWNALSPHSSVPLAPSAHVPTPAEARGAQPQPIGRAAKDARLFKLSTTQLTKSAPNRTALLQTQIKYRDEQNRIALSLKGQWARQAALTRVPTSSSTFAGAPGHTSSLAAASEARSPLAARNAKTEDALAGQPDGIWFVNNQSRDFIITPGGNVVIFGKGFGPSPGQVFAKGLTGFPGGAAALQVRSWGNFEIDAVLPPGIRGVADLDGIAVQVLAPAGKSFTLGNGKFIAAREEITLPSGIDMRAVFDVEISPNWTVTQDNSGSSPSGGGFGTMNTSSVALTQWGGVGRYEAFTKAECKRPGTDTFIPKPLPRGFEVTAIGMVNGRTDTGDGNGMLNDEPGNHLFIPGYSITWGQTKVATGRDRDKLVDSIAIGWGIWRSHTSPGLGPNSPSEDICMSAYQIVSVTAVGPAGLAPF